MSAVALKAPFPWFGGKSRVANVVWRAFGDVPNYVEPFAGSLAVLLGRPHEPKIETVNDIDCHLSNFWRALAADPDALAEAVDWPVNEADLHARHRWLVTSEDTAAFRESMKSEPEFYDVRRAAWWAWGLCQWIGTGWCRDTLATPSRQLPHLGAGRGLHRKLPHLGDAGRGVAIGEYFAALSARLRGVRVACGDWSRITGDSVTWRHGITGVLLDPPYDDGEVDYAAGGRVSSDVRAWAIEAGERKDMRIALCGYDGEHAMPEGWTVHAWKANGGYGSQRRDGTNENAARERVWFSPHCLAMVERQPSLFGGDR